MLSRYRSDLTDARLKSYFDNLSPEITVLPLYKNDFGLPKETIRDYYYRVGFNYRPPKS
jgi:hypothetical protein